MKVLLTVLRVIEKSYNYLNVFYAIQLYQYYAKREPVDVHQILKKYKTDYIILEDSICLAPSRGGCRLPDLLDVDNGMVSPSLFIRT